MKYFRKTSQSGFTLIEIMVVVVILAILAAVIVPKIMSRPDEARIVKTKQDILALEEALELYKLDNGFYPSTDQGLNALLKAPKSEPLPAQWRAGGYLKRLPNDPWGHAYQYLNPGEHGDIDIYSLGPNNNLNNTDPAKIIGNWSLN